MKTWPAVLCLFLSLFAASTLHAAGRIELELVTEADFPPLEVSKWYQELTKLNFSNLKIRRAQIGDRTETLTQGSKDNPIYRVKGILTNEGKMVVLGGSFSLHDRSKIQAWMTELATYGPQGSPEGKPLFGLNISQFETVRKDLSVKVSSNTKGVKRRDAFAAIQSKLTLPLQLDPTAEKAFADSDQVEIELRGVTAGTSLAYLLRPIGLAMRPQRMPNGDLRYVVSASKNIDDPWPVGWPLAKSRKEVAPRLFEFIDVEIEPIPLSQALPVLQERLEIPFLLDRNNLVRYEVNIDEIKVDFPAKRSTYSLILSRLLTQARLTSEVRADEGGQPFVWITTFKK